MLPKGTSSAQLLASPSCSIPNLRRERRKGGFKSERISEVCSNSWDVCVCVSHTCPVSWAATNAEVKPSSMTRTQLWCNWHMPVTGA